MPKWFSKIPEWFLYPLGVYLAVTDWIEDHPHGTFWLGVLAFVAVLVF